jgi:hypothetical protein
VLTPGLAEGREEVVCSAWFTGDVADWAPGIRSFHIPAHLGQRSPVGVSNTHFHRVAICRAFCGSTVVVIRSCLPQRSHCSSWAFVASRYLSNCFPRMHMWGAGPATDAPVKRRREMASPKHDAPSGPPEGITQSSRRGSDDSQSSACSGTRVPAPGARREPHLLRDKATAHQCLQVIRLHLATLAFYHTSIRKSSGNYQERWHSGAVCRNDSELGVLRPRSTGTPVGAENPIRRLGAWSEGVNRWRAASTTKLRV